MVGLLSAALLTESADAAATPVKNGKITACYKLRGKAKGSLRLLAGKGRCKRGERKLSWSVSGPPGVQGAPGAQGGQGAQGQEGPAGPQGNPGAKGDSPGASLAGLETEVASLTLEVKALEDLLEGVGGGDLAGALSKLDGVTGAQLDEAVGSVPVVSSLVPKVANVEGLLTGVGSGDLEGLVSGLPDLESTVTSLGSTVTGIDSSVTGLASKTGALCTQASNLTNGVNSLSTGVTELKVLGLGGLSLDTSSLPSKLGAFNCP